MSDRDSRISTGSAFKDWTDAELYLLQRNIRILMQTIVFAPEATAESPFSGFWSIRIYGLKASALGKALVTLDGKKCRRSFYTAELPKGHGGEDSLI